MYYPQLRALVFSATLLTGNACATEYYPINDSHFHLTNYIQEGTDIKDFLKIMGKKVQRVALFGIPLQQTWAHSNTGDYAPEYYLQSDSPLYYYSFTDAYIATVYNALDEKDKQRFDPMITGFNPADMYGVDHIKRVLKTFPGVFSGIGEFTIHKEFVSAKVAGDVASLRNPALDRILDFAGEAGLLVIIHSDIDVPFQATKKDPVYLAQMKTLLERHPKTTIIWAHMGLGRVIHPVAGYDIEHGKKRSPGHLALIEAGLRDKRFNHVYFDISWDELAKYIVATPESITAVAKLINKYPHRFLFGTDKVAPLNEDDYLKVFRQYQPLWEALTPETRKKVLQSNYITLFDRAAKKVRAWERSNL